MLTQEEVWLDIAEECFTCDGEVFLCNQLVFAREGAKERDYVLWPDPVIDIDTYDQMWKDLHLFTPKPNFCSSVWWGGANDETALMHCDDPRRHGTTAWNHERALACCFLAGWARERGA